MFTAIGKFSKSFFVKLLVGIIILPFVFWGMGDVFRGGSQNIVASIDSEKVSTQEFVDYLRRLNLSEDQIKSLPKTDLIEKILSDYIGKKVMKLEIEKRGIEVTDNSLRKIIKNDEMFFKDKNTWLNISLKVKISLPTAAKLEFLYLSKLCSKLKIRRDKSFT